MKTQPGNILGVSMTIAAFAVYVIGLLACDRLIGRRNGIKDVNEYWPHNWPVLGSWFALAILLWRPRLTPQLRRK